MSPITYATPIVAQEEMPEKKSLKQHAREHFNSIGNQIADALEAYIIPEEKMEVVVEFAIKTLSKNPHMKVHRIVRKTVEEFKLKNREIINEPAEVDNDDFDELIPKEVDNAAS